VSYFNLALVFAGAVGVVGGAWPMLSGRNYPGVLGRGFTRGDNLRLKRAPSIYFRVMGGAITSAGILVLAIANLMSLPDGTSAAERAATATLFVIGLMGSLLFVAWLLLLAYRHKLFRWNSP
jgi:hypothetical protein